MIARLILTPMFNIVDTFTISMGAALMLTGYWWQGLVASGVGASISHVMRRRVVRPMPVRRLPLRLPKRGR